VIMQIVIGVLFLVGLVLAFIPWRKILDKQFGNDVAKGFIDLESGSQVRRYNAALCYEDEQGMIYKYKIDNNLAVVVVPLEYKDRYYRGRRLIRAVDGKVEAVPWGEGESVGMPSMDVAILTLGKFANDLGGAFTVANKLNAKWLLVIGGIALLGFVGYKLFFSPGDAGVPVPVPDTGDVPLALLFNLMRLV